MDAKEGGGVTFGIVPIERETVILCDLPPQGFPVCAKVGILSHASQYEPSPDREASCFPRSLPFSIERLRTVPPFLLTWVSAPVAQPLQGSGSISESRLGSR